MFIDRFFFWTAFSIIIKQFCFPPIQYFPFCQQICFLQRKVLWVSVVGIYCWYLLLVCVVGICCWCVLLVSVVGICCGYVLLECVVGICCGCVLFVVCCIINGYFLRQINTIIYFLWTKQMQLTTEGVLFVLLTTKSNR